MKPAFPPGGVLRAILLLIALVAVAVPALVVRFAPPIRHVRPHAVRLVRKVVPQTIVPPVEPVEFVDLPPEEARDFNASVPFSTAPKPAARPFRLRDEPDDLARATDCLATAVLYEAGGDPAGQRAVAQVVVNRVRHPAFPKTICGVIFEGQERSTGCQFSFTCDGALTRWTPSPAMWAAARKIATAALTGSVYRPVGYATHYHTDWVVPYWQSSLDKIAAVGAHLFFRWSGWWGTPPAFNRQVASGEPVIERIAALSDAHRTGTALADADAALADATLLATALVGGQPQPMANDPDGFLVTLPGEISPDMYPALAARTCGDKRRCRFLAWASRSQTPAQLPLNAEQIANMTFSYQRDRAAGLDRTLWNCRNTKRADPNQCMRQQVSLTAMPAAASTPLPELRGVRRAAGSSPSGNDKGATSGTLRQVPAPSPPPIAAGRTVQSITPPGTSPAAAP